MVDQQLAPELTQPNVLVEIDHGPPMRLRHKAQRPVPSEQPLEQITESWSIMFGTEESTSTYRRGNELYDEPVKANGCPEPGRELGFEFDDTAPPNRRVVEVLEDPSLILASRRPQASWAHCAKSQPEQGEETAFVGMHHLRFIEGTKQLEVADHAIGITSSPSSGWNLPIIRRQASFASDLSALAELPARAATEPSAIRNMRPLNDGPFKVIWTPAQASTPPLSDLRSREVLFNKSSNGHGNAVVNEKRVAEDRLASVFGDVPKNTCHCDLPMGHSCTVRLKEPQSMGRKVINDVEPRLPMSWAAGSRTNFAVDAARAAREVFMWMLQYKLMNSQCERQSPLSLCAQATELLLDFVAATISCIHSRPTMRPENARDKQCTEKVHCLLDDPG